MCIRDREYNVIKPFNTFDEENQSIAESFTARLDSLTDLCGVNAVSYTHLSRRVAA